MINANELNIVATIIDNQLPEGMGFALVVFDSEEGLRDFRYISNCERADMIATFEALLSKWKNETSLNN